MEFITLHLRFDGGRSFYVRPSNISAIWESSTYDKDTLILVDGIEFEVEESAEEVRALVTARGIAKSIWS